MTWDPAEPDGMQPGATSNLCVVLLVLGDPFRVESEVWRTCESLLGREELGEVVCVLDGPHWDRLPCIQTFRLKGLWKVVPVEAAVDHPGQLLNRALPLVKAAHLTVLWPGTRYRPQLVAGAVRSLENAPDAGFAYTRTRRRRMPGFPIGHRQSHGSLQMGDMVSWYGTVFRTEAVRRAGGCDPSPTFQRAPGWDLMVRVARESLVTVGDELADSAADVSAEAREARPAEVAWEWDNFPFLRTLPCPLDRIQRGVVAPRGPEWDGPPRNREGRRLRVTVTGGQHEPIHNQLCFYNYFETSEGLELFDWKAMFDQDASVEDLADSDLVIFSRARCANAVDLVDGCRRLGIPTLFMLDDNWLTVGEDWPVYRDEFSAGRPRFEAFLSALRNCTAALVYNELLQGYVEAYQPRVYRIDCNIRLEGGGVPRADGPDTGLLAYAGSARFNEASFEAARAFVEDHPEVRLLHFGYECPPALEDLRRRGRLWLEPGRDYRQYRERIAAIRPEVMIAPLDDSVTSRSKCINKFLEITAAGSLGVYSGISPYTGVVEHGVNGVLVPSEGNESAAAWYEAYEALFADRDRRWAMRRRAWDQVASCYETERVFPRFLAVVEDLVGWLPGQGRSAMSSAASSASSILRLDGPHRGGVEAAATRLGLGSGSVRSAVGG